MADVFLSYAREDLPFVRRLTAALQDRNRDVWVDLDDIIPSAPWMAEIRTAITEADAVVFVITPDSVTSEVCRIELDCAVEAPKRLVPIVARETPHGTVWGICFSRSWSVAHERLWLAEDQLMARGGRVGLVGERAG